jgi:hypothetical protein
MYSRINVGFVEYINVCVGVSPLHTQVKRINLMTLKRLV